MNARTLLWFLGRPPLYPELFRRLGWSLTHRRTPRPYREEQKRLSADWCASTAGRREDFLRDIAFAGEYRKVSEIHPEVWRRAGEAAAACPVVMGGGGEVDLLFHLSLHLRAERVVETGVAYGWSSLAILLALDRLKKGTLVSSDMPYALRRSDRQVGCVVPAELRGRWKLHRLPDRDTLPKVLREWPSIDLAHYDSDKSEQGRAFGYGLLWSALRPGGILVSDDIQDNLAFRRFAEGIGRKPWVLPSRDGAYVGILRK
jgi:predicted O-methyltransferase YrrM